MKTRFAPSPTGFLHIGGARTALFCWLHARHTGGRYVLRIEDTDRERSKQEAVDAIKEGLAWMGLDHDEGPFFQADNTERHLAAAHRLLEEGKAYRCTCSPEEVDAMRKEQRAKGLKPRYDGRCRERTDLPEDASSVIRFKTPQEGETAWEDKIQGRVAYPNNELDDLILVRSDGTPTYNLAVVVDDHEMGIDLVIRGDDHLNNTPRQIPLFEALGHPVPEYAHMPLLHGEDGSKLSKRHGAVSVLHYREAGFLPQALNNYLVRLGWSHGDQEIFSMEEMVEHFDVKDVGRSASVFNNDKLEWVNAQHIKASSPAALVEPLTRALAANGVENPDPNLLETLIPSFQERAKTLVEMADKVMYHFKESVEPYEPKALSKHVKGAVMPSFTALVGALKGLESWDETGLEETFQGVLEEQGVKMGKLAQPVRIALTGGPVSPGIYEVLNLLGRDVSLQRLERAATAFQEAIDARQSPRG